MKFLNEASIQCKVTKAGIKIEEAKLEVPFGNAEGSSFWGTLSAGHGKGKGSRSAARSTTRSRRGQ